MIKQVSKEEMFDFVEWRDGMQNRRAERYSRHGGFKGRPGDSAWKFMRTRLDMVATMYSESDALYEAFEAIHNG